ncbi:hypothetical protein I2494_11290 [Budviciaceae bacterium BWR-B9]|uniref:Uncharacterized protein n=1 Tax=Limnobaculum allomyrinae TaxID=2791986 RepID=A0ABS1IRE5_9GAMM|nr:MULTISPECIES: hypothetical protein [Limnobaculum]MBK5144294.1 hypothetical protein [Limnobaculum allomyrinae]MBV7691961.1 hypothetical protein [Limnobaculum sp. M2-1]
MNTEKNVLPIPALPIIQSTVLASAPTFGGGRHDGHMNVLCALVRGEKTAEEAANYLKENVIDTSNDKAFSLFVGERRPEQDAACAAYIASTVLIPPNFGEFLEPAADKSDDNKDGKQEFSINQERLNASLTTKLAVALANVDVFALIARILPENLTVEAYRTEITRLFGLLAPVYMERVQAYFHNGLNFNLLQMQNNQFTFTSSNGYVFNYDINGLSLRLGGINWYGSGQLMGQEHYLNVDYFTPKVAELLK